MKDKGERQIGHGDHKADSSALSPQLSDLGITYNQSSQWQELAEVLAMLAEKKRCGKDLETHSAKVPLGCSTQQFAILGANIV